jgi:predicted DNA-binding ribbon-helix-helix protein
LARGDNLEVVKFMQSLEGPPFRKLKKIAKQRGVSLQGLIRAVVIPEWMREEEKKNGK